MIKQSVKKSGTVRVLDYLAFLALGLTILGWVSDRKGWLDPPKVAPYDQVNLMHDWMPDGRLLIWGTLRKLQCERLSIDEDGFYAVAWDGSKEVRIPWAPEDDRDVDHNRPPGVDSIAVSVRPPERYEWIELRTIHACPVDNPKDPDTQYVLGVFYHLQGNLSKKDLYPNAADNR